MSEPASPAPKGAAKVAVVIGATSKWQADGINTRFAHGRALADDHLPESVRWGVGGAVARKFAAEGFFVALTTRRAANAAGLAASIERQGGACMIVELDLSREESIRAAFARIRARAGDPGVVIYNAGSILGRELPPEMELLEYMPTEHFDAVHHIAARGPFLVAKETLPAMREAGAGSLFFTNNPKSLRGAKRLTGESLYYPRVMSRALAQALAEEYSPFGVHVASVIVNGAIDSPGTRELYDSLPDAPEAGRPRLLVDPARIADAFWYLHTQDPSCWTHELQVTPRDRTPAY